MIQRGIQSEIDKFTKLWAPHNRAGKVVRMKMDVKDTALSESQEGGACRRRRR